MVNILLHVFIYGLLLGWGAAIPIGPINLEVMRRNLQFGAPFGISFGFGACCADLVYIVLICAGALAFLKSQLLLEMMGVLGAALLCWFAYQAFTLGAMESKSHQKPRGITRSIIEGFLLTLLNPPTILFWLSVSAQVLILTGSYKNSIILASIGVISATFSWVLTLNFILSRLHHRLSKRAILTFNRAGGTILLLFAAYTIYRVF